MPDVAEMLERYAAAVERSVPLTAWPTALAVGEPPRRPRPRRALLAVAAAFVVVAAATAIAVTSRDEDRGIRTDPEPVVTTTTVPLDPVIVPRALPADQAPTWREVSAPPSDLPPTVVAVEDGFVAVGYAGDRTRAWWTPDGEKWEERAITAPAMGMYELLGYHDGTYFLSATAVASDGSLPLLLAGRSLDQLRPVDLPADLAPVGRYGRMAGVAQLDAGDRGVIALTYESLDLNHLAFVPDDVPASSSLQWSGDEIRATDADGSVVWSARFDEIMTPEELAIRQMEGARPSRTHVLVANDGGELLEVQLPFTPSDRLSVAALPDGFAVFERTSDAVETPDRMVWFSSDGATWNQVGTVPAHLPDTSGPYPQLDGWAQWIALPIAGAPLRGLPLDDIDRTVEMTARPGDCADEGGTCQRAVLRPHATGSTTVAVTSASASDRWVLYWTPDGNGWTASTLADATGVDDRWWPAALADSNGTTMLLVMDMSRREAPIPLKVFVSTSS